MLITSARRTVNTDHVAEAAFYEKTVYERKEEAIDYLECNVIVLTFSDGRVGYYAPIENIFVETTEAKFIECYGDPLFFADLLANLFQ